MPLPSLLQYYEFNCATLAEGVNYFVGKGESASIKELLSLDINTNKKRILDFRIEQRLSWLCRLLFLPRTKEPLRWAMIGGYMDLPYTYMPLKNWPHFPLCFSGTSFFALSESLAVGGMPESLTAYIRYCRSQGTFRRKPLPIPTREQALRDANQLRESATWKAVTWESVRGSIREELDEETVWKFILKQAQTTP